METRKRLLYFWTGYLKLYIKINWFSNNFQVNIFIADNESWTKRNKNLLNRLVTLIIKTPKDALKKEFVMVILEWSSYLETVNTSMTEVLTSYYIYIYIYKGLVLDIVKISPSFSLRNLCRVLFLSKTFGQRYVILLKKTLWQVLPCEVYEILNKVSYMD